MAAALLLAACSSDPAAPNLVGGNESTAPAAAFNQAIVANDAAAPAPTPATAAVSRATPPVPPRHEAYRAIGTEPFWAVTLRGSVATLERPDKAPLRFPVARTDDRRAIRYLGEGFAMVLTEGPCSDGMNDAIWSDRVQISFGEGTLKGCGGTSQGGE